MRRNASAISFVVLWCVCSVSASGAERPNIVFILSDDLGVEALGCQGGESYAAARRAREYRH